MKSASIFNLRERQASWTKVGSCSSPQTNGRLTVISCTLPPKVPLSRISFQIPAENLNFRRIVTLEDPNAVVSSGEVSRVRVDRAGTLVTNEDLAVNVSGNYSQLTIHIDNGDNPPLPITVVQPLTLERRVYFEPGRRSTLQLYYGDARLPAPIYDYARFFHVDPAAARPLSVPVRTMTSLLDVLTTVPGLNATRRFCGLPMIVAVLVLAVLALRGLRSNGSLPP